jgi:proteasome accessory factor A
MDPAQGLFYGLLENGSFRLPYPRESIYGQPLRAPATTRAALRGGCIEKFGALVESAQWDGVVLNDAGRRIELDLGDVFSPELVAWGRDVIARAKNPEDLLSLPFAKRV